MYCDPEVIVEAITDLCWNEQTTPHLSEIQKNTKENAPSTETERVDPRAFVSLHFWDAFPFASRSKIMHMTAHACKCTAQDKCSRLHPSTEFGVLLPAGLHCTECSEGMRKRGYMHSTAKCRGIYQRSRFALLQAACKCTAKVKGALRHRTMCCWPQYSVL